MDTFDPARLRARLQQAPPPLPGAAGAAPPPSRWSLRAMGAAFPELADYSLSGLWRLARRAGLRLRAAAVEQFSPDPAYAAKVARIDACLREAARQPGRSVALWLDEMGFNHWPDPGRDWQPSAPAAPALARHRPAKPKPWRIVAALDTLTGRVLAVDGYIVGRRQVGQCYRRISAAYPEAERIYVIQDNWRIHTHPDVTAVLAKDPRLEPVWLPTYASWLNPIEKLWRWLRQAVLRLHRHSDDWATLLGRVRAFLAQFAHGSTELLTYVGLNGAGRWAQAVHGR